MSNKGNKEIGAQPKDCLKNIPMVVGLWVRACTQGKELYSSQVLINVTSLANHLGMTLEPPITGHI